MAIRIDTSNTDLDWDAFEQSEKILLIAFIVLVVLSNVIWTLVTIGRRGKDAFTQSRYTVRLSLAVGGCLLGIFSFVVIAVVMFENDPDHFSCVTVSAARIYDTDFLPVFYACGLSLIVIDVIARSKHAQWDTGTAVQSYTSNANTILAFAFALLPWMISLAVVCPLALTEVEWSGYCASRQKEVHIKARVIVCGLVTTGIVLLGAIACLWSVQIKSMTHGRRKNVYTFDSPMADGNSNDLEMGDKVEHASPPATVTGQSVNTDSSKVAFATSSPNFESRCANVHAIQYRRNTLYFIESIRLEALVAMLCCIVFVITVVPYSGMCLYIMDNYPNTRSYLYVVEDDIFIALDVLVWFKTLFPVIVPMISLAV